MLEPAEGNEVLVHLGRVSIYPCTAVHPQALLPPCTHHIPAPQAWHFNSENDGTNIKYQIDTKYSCTLSYQCSSCLGKLLQQSILSLKENPSKLMKHKNVFVIDTY